MGEERDTNGARLDSCAFTCSNSYRMPSKKIKNLHAIYAIVEPTHPVIDTFEAALNERYIECQVRSTAEPTTTLRL